MSEKLTIVYLHQYFNTPMMSGGTRSYEMARRLVRQGHEVHMVTSWRDDEKKRNDWFYTNEAGIHVHWLPLAYSNNMNYLQRIVAFFRFALSAARKAASLKGSVIFATSTPLTIALPAVFASKRQKIPMVFEVRDLWPELPIAMGALPNSLMRIAAYRLEKWAYRNAAAVIALSPGMKEGVTNTGYPENQVAVIPNSSDNADFQISPEAISKFRSDRKWLADHPLIIYTGTFGKINGVSYMVDLAVEISKIDMNIRILLIGDGQELDVVREYAQRSGVLNMNLFIEEKIPKKDVPAAVGAAQFATSLFIDLPEMQPNSANKFFDALASGTPIIINYGGWQADLIHKSGCGVCLWKKTVADAALEVVSCIHEQEWLAQSGSAARLLAETLFDRDQLAKEFESVIINAVNGKASKASTISPGVYDVLDH